MTDRRAQADGPMLGRGVSLHDDIDRLTEEVFAAYQLLPVRGGGRERAGCYCSDPAAAWAADTAIRGRTLPVNPATVQALEAAVTSLLRASTP